MDDKGGQQEEMKIGADQDDRVEFDEDLTIFEGEEQIVHLVINEMSRDDVQKAKQDIFAYDDIPRETLVASIGVFVGHTDRLNKIMVNVVKAFRQRSQDLDRLISRLEFEIREKKRSVFVNSKTGLPNAQCLWRDSTMYDAHLLNNNIPFLVIMIDLERTAADGKIEFQDVWNMGCLLNDSDGYDRVFALQDENQKGGYMIGIFSLNSLNGSDPIEHAQRLVRRYVTDLQYVHNEGFFMGAAVMMPSPRKECGTGKKSHKYVNRAMKALLESQESWSVQPQLCIVEVE